MEIRVVDPRDAEWEIKQPKYRVHFHDPKGAADEYEIDGADVADVLAWVELRRGDRTFVLYACVPHERLGLIRLLGHDPKGP